MRECSHKVLLKTRALKVEGWIGYVPENFQMWGNAGLMDIATIFNLMTARLEFA